MNAIGWLDSKREPIKQHVQTTQVETSGAARHLRGNEGGEGAEGTREALERYPAALRTLGECEKVPSCPRVTPAGI